MADADVTIADSSNTDRKVDTRTVGAGTDEHRQVVVIGDPTTAAGVAPVDATNGLTVDVARVIPGTQSSRLGKANDAAAGATDTGVAILGVRNGTPPGTDGDYGHLMLDSLGNLRAVIARDLARYKTDSAGLTIAATAYTAGDQVGSMFSFTSAARSSGGGGILRAAELVDSNDIIGSYDLLLFRSNVTLAADNAAFAISDTEARDLIQPVVLGSMLDLGANRVAAAYNLDIPYDCSGGTTLYAALRCGAGHTFFAATSDLTLILWLERS